MDSLCPTRTIWAEISRQSDNILYDKTRGQPPEIMTKIFMSICEGTVALPPLDDGYPWMLGHVCSRWRQILWNSPAIWNSITVGYGQQGFNRTLDHRFSHISIYEKTASETLQHILQYIHTPVSLTVLKGNLRYLFNIILAHLGQFSELSLCDIYHDSLFQLLNVPPNTFSALEKLELSVISVRKSILEYTASALQTAPKLRSVTYKMQQSTYVSPLFLLPWTRMEEIHVEVMTVSPLNIYQIWQSAPSLISCTFSIRNVEIINLPQQITLPALKEMNLWTPTAFDWECFFAPVVTPALESIKITSSLVAPRPLASLIARSCCSIQSLGVFEQDNDKIEIDATDLELLFEHLPSMTHFFGSWTIPLAAIRSIHRGALPKLVHVAFSVYPEAFGACLDMIDSYIAQNHSPRRYFTYFGLLCHDGIGFVEMEHRYQTCHDAYNAFEGLSVLALNGNTYRHMELDSDEEDTDEEEDVE